MLTATGAPKERGEGCELCERAKMTGSGGLELLKTSGLAPLSLSRGGVKSRSSLYVRAANLLQAGRLKWLEMWQYRLDRGVW